MHNPQLGMTHVNVGNNGMFVGPGPGQHPGHMLGGAGAGQPLTMAAPSQQLQPGPGQPPYVQNTRPGPGPGEADTLQPGCGDMLLSSGNQRGGQGGKEAGTGGQGRPELPSPLQVQNVTGLPIQAGGVAGHHPQFIAGGYPGHGQYPGPHQPGHPGPVVRMVMPGGMMAGPGLVPVMSQHQQPPDPAQPGQNTAAPMWTGGQGGPGQHPPPPPPQPNTPAPSPGTNILQYIRMIF